MTDLREISSNSFKKLVLSIHKLRALVHGITGYCVARLGMEIWNRLCAPDFVKPEILDPDPLGLARGTDLDMDSDPDMDPDPSIIRKIVRKTLIPTVL